MNINRRQGPICTDSIASLRKGIMDALLPACICLLVAHGALGLREGPVVSLEQGQLRGTVLTSAVQGRDISAFLGIPYAKPPLDDLRFQPPQNPEKWEGVRDASKEGPSCPQVNLLNQMAVEGEEDCLTVNVYTPKVPSKGTKPHLDVMVWIHPGGFMFYSSTSFIFGPEFLLDHDVVLVTFNYRLAALGFLSTGDDVCQGNMGLKDQNLLLHWVQANIAQFGGNPDSVTIFGESAGAASVHYHLLSPNSRGLFQRAISQSGSALCPWAFVENPRARALQLGFVLGCPTNSSVALVECLKKLPALSLAKAYYSFLEFSLDPPSPFGPVVEVDNDVSFLTEDPYKLIREGRFADVPWIVGVTSEEGSVRVMGLINDKNSLERLNKEYLKLAPLTFGYEDRAYDSDTVSRKLRQFYFKDKPIGEETFEDFINIYSDRFIIHGVYEAARYHSLKSTSPVFFYVFGHKGQYGIKDLLVPNDTRNYGVAHLDDVQFLFPNKAFPPFPKDSQDEVMSNVMVTLWTTFAATGNPTTGNELLDWPPMVYDHVFEHLDIKFNMGRSFNFPYKRMDNMNSLPLRENSKRVYGGHVPGKD